LSGQDEKKNMYLPVSAQILESASTSKNSPDKEIAGFKVNSQFAVAARLLPTSLVLAMQPYVNGLVRIISLTKDQILSCKA